MTPGRVDGETVRLHNLRNLLGREFLTPFIARKEKNLELLRSKLLVPALELTVGAGGRASTGRDIDQQGSLAREGCQAEVDPADVLGAQGVKGCRGSGSGRRLERLGL